MKVKEYYISLQYYIKYGIRLHTVHTWSTVVFCCSHSEPRPPSASSAFISRFSWCSNCTFTFSIAARHACEEEEGDVLVDRKEVER